MGPAVRQLAVFVWTYSTSRVGAAGRWTVWPDVEDVAHKARRCVQALAVLAVQPADLPEEDPGSRMRMAARRLRGRSERALTPSPVAALPGLREEALAGEASEATPGDVHGRVIGWRTDEFVQFACLRRPTLPRPPITHTTRVTPLAGQDPPRAASESLSSCTHPL